MDRNLDIAERVLQSATGGRRESEVSFLQGLLSDIGARASAAAAMSPARLYRTILGGGPASENMRNALEIVARPSERPDGALRAGDWMLRVVPGTGDTGHVTVLVSDDLQAPSAFVADGINAESAQDGQYGVVVEAGAFPHNRSRPFARRWLDGRGRVPPHSLVLRPRRRQTAPTLDPPASHPHTLDPLPLDPPAPEPPDVDPPGIGLLDGGLLDGGLPEDGSLDGSRDQDTAEDMGTFTPPAWLKVERRSRRVKARATEGEAVEYDTGETQGWVSDDGFVTPPWLKIERRSRRLPEETEFAPEDEAFTFDPTGAQTDFGPKLRKAWHELLKAAFKKNIDEATNEIATRLRISTAAAAKHVRFFSPASRSPAVMLSAKNVPWRAFPTSRGAASPATYKHFDELHADPTTGAMLRDQDEYCEWKVFRDGAGKIVRVVFTSEPPEYYRFLHNPGVASLTKFARGLLVKLYQERCGSKAVTLADLETTAPSGDKVYDPGNRWNRDHCVHLQQPNNTLGAQINIAALASIVMKDASGALITSVSKLIPCTRFGEASRQSDPFIGDNVNKLARDNHFVTLQNPVGLYMVSLDTSGWTTPDGTDAQKFWKVIKGKVDKSPGKSMIVRAEYAVPAGKGYTVSDIKIGGAPIEFGSQIAEQLEMRLGALAGPKDKDPEGRATTPPPPAPC